MSGTKDSEVTGDNWTLALAPQERSLAYVGDVTGDPEPAAVDYLLLACEGGPRIELIRVRAHGE
jgi:hypothetical protein